MKYFSIKLQIMHKKKTNFKIIRLFLSILNFVQQEKLLHTNKNWLIQRIHSGHPATGTSWDRIRL